MERIAFYDMDKTITRRPTWTPFLIHHSMHHAAWRLPLLLPVAGIFALGYLLGLVGRARLKELTQRVMMGGHADPDEVARSAERFAAILVARGVYKSALARIAADRAAGWRVVLATASCRFYVDAIAARLGIADVIATEVQHDAHGNLLPRIAGENCYGPAKLRMVEAWLAANRLTRAAVTTRFYSDHVSDAPALAWADEAIAVCPHGRLRALAAGRQWQVIDWTA